MQRRTVECRGPEDIRPNTTLRVLGLRYGLPLGRIRVVISHTYSNEARRHQDRQARKADDPHRILLGVVHRAGGHSNRVPLLRAPVLRLLDAHLDQRHVQEAVLHTVSQGQGCGVQAAVRGLHDQVPHVHDRGIHVECLDLVWEDHAQLEGLHQQVKRTAHSCLRMRVNVEPFFDESCNIGRILIVYK